MHKNFPETRRQHMSSLLCWSITNIWHQIKAFKFATNAIVNTLGLPPVTFYLGISITLMTNEFLCTLLHYLRTGSRCNRHVEIWNPTVQAFFRICLNYLNIKLVAEVNLFHYLQGEIRKGKGSISSKQTRIYTFHSNLNNTIEQHSKYVYWDQWICASVRIYTMRFYMRFPHASWRMRQISCVLGTSYS